MLTSGSYLGTCFALGVGGVDGVGCVGVEFGEAVELLVWLSRGWGGAESGVGVPGAQQAPAGAVAYNLTLLDTVNAGHVAVGPAGADLAGTSTANWFGSGQRWANAYVSALGDGGRIQVVARGGPTQFLVDVVGYYAPNAQGGLRFTAIAPSRAYDSRGGGGPITGGQSRTTSVVPASGAVPAGVGAVAFNLTETNTVGRGHLRVAPGGSGLPSVSTINWYTDGMRLANGSVVGVRNDQMTTFGGGQASDYLVDIGGYYN